MSSDADALPAEPAEDGDEDATPQTESVSKKSDESTISFGLIITALLLTALFPTLVGLRRYMLRR